MTTVPGVTGVIVAGRGGDRLGRALASVAWAEERVVLDPAGRLRTAELPAGTRRAESIDLAHAVRTPWVVLLQEDETASGELAAAVGGLTRAARVRGAYRLPQQLEAFGALLRPPGAPVRVARCAGAGLRMSLHGGLELHTPERRPGRLAAPVTIRAAPSLAEAVYDLEADGSVGAAVLAAGAVHAHLGRAALATLAAGARVLVARRVSAGAAAHPWPAARASAALIAGYRTLVAYAKLWERAEVWPPA